MQKREITEAFEGFSPRTIDFLANLSLNNEKVWFEAHKGEYQEVLLMPMRALAQTVYGKVVDKHRDCELTGKVSRIYKDARYLRAGEGPYRTSMWMSIERPRLGTEWTNSPVFWFDISVENWSYGMGYGGAKAETMAKFRAQIDKDPKKFEKLVAFLDKQEEFALEGDEYARKKEAPTAKTADWYNKKSFSIIHKGVVGEELFSADLAERIAKGMLCLMPTYDFLVNLYT